MDNEEKANETDPEILRNSISFGLRRMELLRKEIELLNIEHGGLIDLANKLGAYQKAQLPHEKLNFLEDALYFKWSEQGTRYYAAAEGVHSILVARQDDLKGAMAATLSDMKEAGMEIPPSLEEQFGIEAKPGADENLKTIG